MTGGTVPMVKEATLCLFTGNKWKSLLQRVRNNPPPYPQGKGKEPWVYLAAGEIYETFKQLLVGMVFPWPLGWRDPCALCCSRNHPGLVPRILQAEQSKGSHGKGCLTAQPPRCAGKSPGGWVREQIQLEISSAWEALGRSRIARAVLRTGVLSSGLH